MKIAVCVKQSIDSEAVLAFDEAGRVAKEGQTLVVDPYSEFAVEKAVRIKEEIGAEVVAVCLGGAEAVSALRHVLAMGADSAIFVEDEALADGAPAVKASVLADILRDVQADLVLGGCKSSDTAHAQVMPRIARMLDIPHVNTAVGLDIEGPLAHAVREIDDGTVTIDVALPAVVCAQQGLAEPRYPTVRDIMQSKRKPVERRAAGDGATDIAETLQVLESVPKPRRSGGRILEGDDTSQVAAETVRLLRDEAKAL